MVRTNQNHKLMDKRRGQGMLEFALAIPIFLLLVLGIIEFGRMFLMYTSVFAGAREGARYGAAVETICDPTGLEAASRRAGFFAGDMNIVIQYDDGLGTPKDCPATVLGDRVHVTASVNFSSITGIIPDLTLSSTARRTIIKQVFLSWTLEPTSANVGGVPPTPRPTATITPTVPTNTPTETYTPDPNATDTATPTNTSTPTATTTPLPPQCVNAEAWEIGTSSTTIYYDLTFTNPNEGIIDQLTVVSISWDMAGGKVLDHIEYKSALSSSFERVWTGPKGDGYLIWYPDPTLPIYWGSPSVLRFVFRKEDVTVNNISLVVSSSIGECTLTYPPTTP